MKSIFTLFLVFLFTISINAQDLSTGYIANDLDQHPMQSMDKPAYLAAAEDQSFPGTLIRRISEANTDGFVAPMYSTIQAWNADETRLILYSNGNHQLLNGVDYSFIRTMDDINPEDLEAVFWHFSNPDILFYIDNNNGNLIEYNVSTQAINVLADLVDLSDCQESITGGNDVQMMSWDSDVISFRCGNTSAFYYRISTQTLVEFDINSLDFNAPMPFPSGNLFYHRGNVYNSSGILERSLNLDVVNEHSCLGRLSNGDDAYFAIAFEEGPDSNCQGTLVAHNATNANCFSVTPTGDYGYPQSGTHISSLAHSNTEGGWIAVSCVGYDQNGVDLLDQELFIAKVNENDADVYRVAHHRSDRDQLGYWGEPHVIISPSGTRLLFGSDWSGSEDGISVDSYVAELPANTLGNSIQVEASVGFDILQNPVNDVLKLQINAADETNGEFAIYDVNGRLVKNEFLDTNQNTIDVSQLQSGLFFIRNSNDKTTTLKFIKI
ncbi:T9SS type A sorting domain-containing protein [Patiriisocius marinus]|uniref:Secretion system C-terminal sorting domain-containing protein n=1 Tax=Patiriisocius marinus TaxID=1397112 RepID=A0A5J4J012_9FLAO|nr:T9SS type A sorting domain-containing protein [Patiriisocius marinus]GER59171.1 hypothetical protein ULMA_12790 [Patiriisocius marinus]